MQEFFRDKTMGVKLNETPIYVKKKQVLEPFKKKFL